MHSNQDRVHSAKLIFVGMPRGEVLGDVCPKPYVTVTINPDIRYIEWAETTEGERRKGYASEAVAAIETVTGPLECEGVTKAGEAFHRSYRSQRW